MDDLANYTALVKEPTVSKLSNGVTVYGVPPPGSGAIVSNILMTLDGYNLDPSDLETDDSDTLMHHRIVEAFKFAYAKRTAMGDPDFVDMTGVSCRFRPLDGARDDLGGGLIVTG